MTTFNVSSASQLSTALQSAKGGDVILLSGGQYGDFTISAKSFASDITIASADAGHPASFNTLNIKSSANINFQGVNVDFSPTVSTVSFSTAVMVDKSSGISFANGIIKGGPAISGVSADSTGTDGTDNVIGQPTGRGMTIQGSSDVTVQGMDISSFMRGIAIGDSKQVTIKDNEIHDLRKTAIVGNADDLVIEGNYLHSAHPWRIGEVGGDHADFIALWTDPKQDHPTTNVTIKDNVLSQGDGARILGLWLQGDKAGYVNVVIEGNAILGGDNQGIMMSNTTGGRVTDNVLVQTTSYDKSPGILLLEGAKNIQVTDNIAWAIADKNNGSTNNVIADNTLVQKVNALKAGFYDVSLISKIVGLEDAQAIYKLVAGDVGAPLGHDAPVVVPPPVVTDPPPVVIQPEVPSQPVAEHPDEVQGMNLVGNGTNNHLVGGVGDDMIDGRGGTDVLAGGKGNDVYVVPNALATIVEKAGEGIDTVIARGDHVLAANVENLALSTEAKNGWAGTGNELNNVILGNDGNNRLDGAAGADTLDGGVGSDTLTGGAGDDRLIGGAGVDMFKFVQGSGDDLIVDFGVGGRDVIDISAFTKAGLKATVVDTGPDTVISFANGDSITLMGVDSHHVKADGPGFVYV